MRTVGKENLSLLFGFDLHLKQIKEIVDALKTEQEAKNFALDIFRAIWELDILDYSLYSHEGVDMWIERQSSTLNVYTDNLNKLINKNLLSSAWIITEFLKLIEEKTHFREKKTELKVANTLYVLLQLREASILTHSEVNKILAFLVDDLDLPDGQSLRSLRISRCQKSEEKKAEKGTSSDSNKQLLADYLNLFLPELISRSNFLPFSFLETESSSELIRLLKQFLNQNLSHLVDMIEHRFSQSLFVFDGSCEFMAFEDPLLEEQSLRFIFSLDKEEKKQFILLMSLLLLYSMMVSSFNFPAKINNLTTYLVNNRHYLSNFSNLVEFTNSEDWLELSSQVAVTTSGWNRFPELTEENLKDLFLGKKFASDGIIHIGGAYKEPLEMISRLRSFGYDVPRVINVDRLSPQELFGTFGDNNFSFSKDGLIKTSNPEIDNLSRVYSDLVIHLIHCYGFNAESLLDALAKIDFYISGLVFSLNSVRPHASDEGLFESIYDSLKLLNKNDGGFLIGGYYYSDLNPLANLFIKAEEGRLKVKSLSLSTKNYDQTHQHSVTYEFVEDEIEKILRHQLDRREWMNDPSHQANSRALLAECLK